MFEKKDQQNKDWLKASTREFWRYISGNKHVMQVYSDEQALTSVLSGFCRSAIQHAEPVIIVATPEHISSLSRNLQLFGVDTDRLRFSRQLVLVDAAAMLSEFMNKKSWPDEKKFNASVSRLLNYIGADEYTPVKIYGEMVALLWAEGKKEATLALEEMWNRACAGKRVTLFCGYPRNIVADDERGEIIHICAQHASLLGSESPSFSEVRFRQM